MDTPYKKSLTEHTPGTIFSLLNKCYAGLSGIKPEYSDEWIHDWQAYDDEIFNHPETVGACGFVTYLNNDIVGFASWDPRKHPVGIIGHNCILPEFQGNGYGQYQINEIIKLFKQMNFKKALASTMDHAFFTAAQKMYIACGFYELKKYSAEGKNYKIIEYEKYL